LARARSRAEEEREEQKRRGIIVRVEYGTRDVDPFGVMTGAIGTPRQRGEEKAGEKQVAVLAASGVPMKLIKRMSAADARRLLDELASRRRRGLCTYPQARRLASTGLPTDLTFEQAKVVMGELRTNGWLPLPRWRVDALAKQFREEGVRAEAGHDEDTPD
jgi:hypothetical protein